VDTPHPPPTRHRSPPPPWRRAAPRTEDSNRPDDLEPHQPRAAGTLGGGAQTRGLLVFDISGQIGKAIKVFDKV